MMVAMDWVSKESCCADFGRLRADLVIDNDGGLELSRINGIRRRNIQNLACKTSSLPNLALILAIPPP